MKVYVVFEGFEYEGEDVVKIFLSKEKADALRDDLEKEDENGYYSYTVGEYEVEE